MNKEERLIRKMQGVCDVIKMIEARFATTMVAEERADIINRMLNIYFDEYQRQNWDMLYKEYEDHIAPRSTNNGENMEGFDQYCTDEYIADMKEMLN